MPSYSSVDWTEDGLGNPIKMHGNMELRTDVLKGSLKFDGFVISDWEGIHQLPGDWPTQVRSGVNAGIDMMMEPSIYKEFETTLADEVNAGRVSMSRINDAVSRILTKKFELGLFEHPYTDRTNLPAIGSPAHRAVARKAVAESQVLLKNAKNALPITTQGRIYVAGSNADSIGNQAGGWTLTWQGGSTTNIPGTSILSGIRKAAGHASVTYSADASAPVKDADMGIVVVGETPYSEGFGDVGGPLWAGTPQMAGRCGRQGHAAISCGQGCRGQGLLRCLQVRGGRCLRPPADPRPEAAVRDRRARGGLAARRRGRRCCRHPLRDSSFQRQASRDLAAHSRTGADQHRRRQL